MSLFKSKEEKEFERKVLIRNTINKLKNHIKMLEKNKKYWLDKAVEAKSRGWEQQYIIAKNGLKIILEQEKKSQLMLSRVELAKQVKEFSLLGKDFLNGIISVCKNIVKISNSMDFGTATKEFDLAMERSSKDMDKLDAHLETKNNQGLGTEFIGEAMDIDEQVDGMVRDLLSKDEKEWNEIAGTIDASDFSVKSKTEIPVDGKSFESFINSKNTPENNDDFDESDDEDIDESNNKNTEKDNEDSGKKGSGKLKGVAMRPQTLDDYFGQPKAVKLLKEVITASKKLGQPLGHILLYGGPGLGKTTLANIIANEMNTRCIEINGPAIKQVSDLISVMKEVNEGDIVFIDEIHRIPKAVSEAVYSAIEDFQLCYFEGSGDQRRSVRKPLPRFTLIGATTDPGLLAKPFKARLSTQIRLNPYDTEVMKTIILNVANKNGIVFPDELASELSKRCQETPRLAVNYVKRLTNKLVSRDLTEVTRDILDELYEDLGIDSAGLTVEQQDLLKAIVVKFNGGPVGIETLASCIGEDKDNVISVHEPYLKLQGFINVVKQGRYATEKAFKHFGAEMPNDEEYLAMADDEE